MADLYERCPSADWYLFADCDSFLYPNAIIDYQSALDSELPEIHGRVFNGIQGLERYFKSGRDSSNFAQGGAGVLISQRVMKGISPFLPGCAMAFAAPQFPSDLRLTACLNHFFNKKVTYIQCKTMMNGDRPEKVAPRTEVGRPLLSFHRILSANAFELWNATTSVWTAADGIDRIIDWNSLTMFWQTIPMGSDDRLISMLFGYRLFFHAFGDSQSDLNFENWDWIRAMTQIEPVFNESDPGRSNPTRFYQRFERGIRLEYICDEAMFPGEITVDSFLDVGEAGVRLRVRCPEVGRFPVTHPNGVSPRIVTYGNAEEENPIGIG
jgi:hypothetical protein